MNAAGRFRYGTIAMAVFAACAPTRAAEPSIPLKVSLVIPETCTIGQDGRTAAGAEMPSVTCTHGTPFVLTRVSAMDVPAVPHRAASAGDASAWTVTF